MRISSSARAQEDAPADNAQERGATVAPITLSERSMLGLALLRVSVGYLWFQQLFWKLPPDFKGLFPYIVRETQFTFIPGFGGLFGLVFGVLQGKRDVTIGRAIATGLGLGVAWWVIFAFLVALVVGHLSLAAFTLGSFLYPFMLCLVYGLLLATIYFQSTVRRVRQAK